VGLAACLVGALLHPDRQVYFRSAARYCAAAACGGIFAPHAVWAFKSGLPTVEYALVKSNRPLWFLAYHALVAAVVGIGANILGTAVLLLALGRRWPMLLPRVWRFWKAQDHAWLVVLGFGPIVATLLLGFVGYVKIAPNFLIPTVYILPLMVLIPVRRALTVNRVRAIMLAAAAFIVFALPFSSVIAYASMTLGLNDRQQVSPAVAEAATKAWHKELGTPLRIATGTEPFSLALPFYSSDSPAEFTHFNTKQAPWITTERIAREGLLCVCEATDAGCLEQAKHYATPETKRIVQRFQKKFWGLRGRVIEVVIIIVPPRAKLFIDFTEGA